MPSTPYGSARPLLLQTRPSCALRCATTSSYHIRSTFITLITKSALPRLPRRCRYAPRVPWLLSFLGHTHAAARTAAARLLGSHVATALTAEAAAVSAKCNHSCSSIATNKDAMARSLCKGRLDSRLATALIAQATMVRAATTAAHCSHTAKSWSAGHAAAVAHVCLMPCAANIGVTSSGTDVPRTASRTVAGRGTELHAVPLCHDSNAGPGYYILRPRVALRFAVTVLVVSQELVAGLCAQLGPLAGGGAAAHPSAAHSTSTAAAHAATAGGGVSSSKQEEMEGCLMALGRWLAGWLLGLLTRCRRHPAPAPHALSNSVLVAP